MKTRVRPSGLATPGRSRRLVLALLPLMMWQPTRALGKGRQASTRCRPMEKSVSAVPIPTFAEDESSPCPESAWASPRPVVWFHPIFAPFGRKTSIRERYPGL